MDMANEQERTPSHPLDQYINHQSEQPNTIVEDFEHQFTEADQKGLMRLVNKLSHLITMVYYLWYKLTTKYVAVFTSNVGRCTVKRYGSCW